MNKNNLLRICLLIMSLSLTCCATPRNPDGTIDACKLTKPPKEAVVENTAHSGQLFIYPAKVPDNYTGCQNMWFRSGSFSAYHLLLQLQINEGLVSHVETLEANESKSVCEFDKNKSLTKGIAEKCLPYEKWTIRRYYGQKPAQ